MTTIAGLLAVALVTVRGQKADRQIVPIPPPTVHTHTHTHNIWLSVICAWEFECFGNRKRSDRAEWGKMCHLLNLKNVRHFVM